MLLALRVLALRVLALRVLALRVLALRVLALRVLALRVLALRVLALRGVAVSALTALAVPLAACGSPPPAAPDAGTDAGPGGPLPPALTPCPDGWREIADPSGVALCDPYPEGGPRSDCAYDEAHFPGTDGCARVGSECPADGWPSGLPTDRPIVYVDAAAPAGGDGATRETALRTIQAGTIFGAPDAIIAVAAGTYEEEVTISGAQTLWGACVSGTRLVATTPSATHAVLALLGDGPSARNLSLDAPERVGILLGGTGTTLEDVVITGARRMGVYVASGPATARRIVVRDVRSDVDRTFGHAIEVRPGAHLAIETGLVERALEHAIVVDGAGALLEAHDLAILDTLSTDGARTYGYALAVGTGARTTLDRAVVLRAREAGIFVLDGTVEARDLVLRDTDAQEIDGTAGHGIVVDGASSLLLERALLDHNTTHGILAAGGSTADVRDVVIRDTRAEPGTLTSGRGIAVQGGSRLILERALLERNRNAALSAHFDAIVEARDVVVRDTLAQESDRSTGVGVWAEQSSAVTLTRARVEGSRLAGIASLLGSTVALDDVVVTGVAEADCARSTCEGRGGGFGLSAHFGGTLTAVRFEVDGTPLCGVVVGGPSLDGTASAMDLRDGVIARTPIGACVQADGFDTARLRTGVEYREVDVPLTATTYTLPDTL